MYENQTETVIKQRMVNNTDLPVNKSEGSDTSNMLSAPALEFSNMYAVADYLLKLITGGIIDDNFVSYAARFGVFRKGGQESKGKGTVVGTSGITIPAGTLVKNIRNLNYKTVDEITLTSSPVQIDLIAGEVGVIYNSDAESLNLVIDIPGVTSITHSGMTGGVDIESLELLNERFLERMRDPSSSGNDSDYKRWSKEVDGIAACKVIPLWNGGGTVKLVVYGELGEPITAEQLAAVIEHINQVKPILANVTIVTVTNLNLIAKIQGLDFDSNNFSESAVKDSIQKALVDYLKSIEPGQSVIYKKAQAVVMAVAGVNDIGFFYLNDAIENIPSTNEQKVRLGGVVYEA